MAKKSGLSLASEIYNMLKERIVNLNYRPGEILLIQQVVNELKASRTPVKEAMVRLVADGYLEMYDRYFRVKEISVEMVLNTIETRQVLEGHVVEKLAATITDTQIEALEGVMKLNDEAFESHNSNELMRLDELFHTLLIEAYGNQTILEIFLELNKRIHALRYMTQLGQRIYLIGSEHRKVIDALKEHNGALAKAQMQEHLERVKSSMRSLLEHREHPLIANAVLYNNIHSK